jgi:UDP-2-acetamido-3-amino-2,3-dideoxy-glucuronate N-acetyltransferase
MQLEYFAHSTAIVDEGAKVGNDTRIWHFCHIMPEAIIGQKCNIGQNVYIDNNVSIGDGVKIQNNVSVYNGVVVEDDAFLGPSMVFTNVTYPRSFVERKSEFKKTVVRKGATIGANATVVCGVEIGEYSLVGAGAMVIHDVPPYAIMAGNPARQIGWISKTGIKLEFDEAGNSFCKEENKWYYLRDNRVSTFLQEKLSDA